MKKSLMDEIFFFMYHLRMTPETSMAMPVYERRWHISKFIEQKEKEQKAIESAKKKSKSK